MEVLPGVEINTDVEGGEAHILGYLLDWRDPELESALARLREARLRRARAMVDKLARLGRPVALERVLEISGGGAVGRPHLARALLERGYVGSMQQAFDLYLGRGAPAYVGRTRLTPRGAVELIRQAGGLAVLAHPGESQQLLPALVEGGLEGLECYYGSYPPAEVEELLATARRYGLVPTGGSDYHGPQGPAELGGTYVPEEVLQGLKARAASRAGGSG